MIATPPYGDSGEDYRSSSTNLYDMLLRPAEHLLKEKRVLVVADASLRTLPFETLISDSRPHAGVRFAGQDFVFSYTSFQEFLAIAQRPRSPRPPPTRILIYADPVYDGRLPRLVSSRYEAMNIARLFPGKTSLLLGQAATKRSIEDLDLSGYSVIHIAAHAVFNDEDTGESGLVLSKEVHSSDDGLLTATDVARLRLGASTVVVLSGCATGRATDGGVGLTNAFLGAGAREVVGSLWPVNDFVVVDFMRKYYAGIKEGQSSSEALTSAKLEMIQSGTPYSHPYYWAPFVHVGAF